MELADAVKLAEQIKRECALAGISVPIELARDQYKGMIHRDDDNYLVRVGYVVVIDRKIAVETVEDWQFRARPLLERAR